MPTHTHNFAGTSRPTVTVGLPVYNGEKSLAQAIESILAQTYRDFELVICDNASTDHSPDICREFARRDPRVRFFQTKRNFGAARNFNRTLELARGKYFRWHAHDDVAAPTYLEKCVQTLDEHPEVALVYPRRQYMTVDGRPMRNEEFWLDANAHASLHDMTFDRLLDIHSSYFVVMEFGLMRTETLRQTGRMGAYITADAVLLPELLFRGRFHEIPEILFYQRVHEETEEYAVRRTKRGEANFMNPDHQPWLLLPGLKINWELAIAIHNAPLSTSQKWSHWHRQIAHLWPRLRKLLGLRSFLGKLWLEWRWSTEKPTSGRGVKQHQIRGGIGA